MSLRRESKRHKALEEEVPPPPPRYSCGPFGVCEENPLGEFETRQECDPACGGEAKEWPPVAFYRAVDEVREAIESGAPADQLRWTLEQLIKLMNEGVLDGTLYANTEALAAVWREILQRATPQQELLIFELLHEQPGLPLRPRNIEVTEAWVRSEPPPITAFLLALAQVLVRARLPISTLSSLFARLAEKAPRSVLVHALQDLWLLFRSAEQRRLVPNVGTVLHRVDFAQNWEPPAEIGKWLRLGIAAVSPLAAARILERLPPQMWEEYGLTIDDFRAVADALEQPPGWLAELPRPAPPAPSAPWPRSAARSERAATSSQRRSRASVQ